MLARRRSRKDRGPPLSGPGALAQIPDRGQAFAIHSPIEGGNAMNPAAARELARLAEITRSRGSSRAETLKVVASAAGLPSAKAEVSARALPLGHPELDARFGGLPAGRVTELLGPASSGKTTLAMDALRLALATPGRPAALVDFTRTVAPQEGWTRSLLVVRPRKLELGLRALDVLLECACFSLVVAAMPPSLRALPESLKVRASRLCRESGTALIACGEQALFGSCSSLRLEIAPSRDGAILRVTKNRQGPLGDVALGPPALAATA
jgi:hypothetical protein